MILSKYDLYDLFGVFTAIRRAPGGGYVKPLLARLDELFLDLEGSSLVEANRIRTALCEVAGLDREYFGFVYVSNKYVYGQAPVSHPLCSRVMGNAVDELRRCAEGGNTERISDLCTALSRIPLFFAEGMWGIRLRLAMRIACAPYRKKYGERLYRTLMK